MLQKLFISITSPYTDKATAGSCWQELERHYSEPSRHYHNLEHLAHMIGELEPLQPRIHDWPTLLLAVFYHDIIYKASRKDNEEKSAALARERLKKMAYPTGKIEQCAAMILATKHHGKAENADTNWLIDADLSILGQDPATYGQYTLQIRKEYSIYPDFLYNPGRKKVLKYFLAMPRIYKTSDFSGKYEQQARINLAAELQRL